MKNSIGLVILAIALLATETAAALPGPAPFETAIAEYDPATGQIIVSVDNVTNWYVQRDDINSIFPIPVMTGDSPASLPLSGGLLSDNDSRIGETKFTPFSYTNVNLGYVAETSIPDDGSLQIYWNPGSGGFFNQAISFATGSINEGPIATINGPFEIDLLNDPLGITLDASGSTDDGIGLPLTYTWDLDNDSVFEISTGTIPTLDIADVAATFGGHGHYPVSVQVSDGEFTGGTSTIVQLISEANAPAYAKYDPATGQIVVSVDGVNNWYLESASFSLTGDEPSGLPADGGLVTNHDQRIGESSLNLFNYEVNLGYVAEPGLPEDDLVIFWSEGLGEPEQSIPVSYGSIVPEPTSMLLTVLGFVCVGWTRRK